MNKLKKLSLLFVIAAFMVACGGNNNNTDNTSENDTGPVTNADQAQGNDKSNYNHGSSGDTIHNDQFQSDTMKGPHNK